MDGKAIRIKHLQEKPAMADIRNIFMHVLEMVLPEPALKRYVKYTQGNNILMVAGKKYNLSNYEQIVVVGGGKAAKRTGAALVNILGDKIPPEF